MPLSRAEMKVKNLFTEDLRRYGCHHLAHTSVIVGWDPTLSNMTDTWRACPDSSFALKRNVKSQV